MPSPCSLSLLHRLLAGLDQLADLLPALVADLLVELVPALVAHGLAALAADLLVELVPALVADLLTTLAARLADRHRSFVFLGHRTLLASRALTARCGCQRPLFFPCSISWRT